MSIIESARNLYARFERPISSVSLVFGFIVDALTLTRVDTTWVSIWVLGHIILIGLFIVIIHKKEKGDEDETDPSKWHFWFVNALQFLFGGILSTFLVSYFRSADIFVTWPFILILVTAFGANEILKRHYVRLSFQLSLYFFAVYSFTIFFIPILTHKIGAHIFLLAGLTSLVFITLFISLLFFLVKDKFSDSKNTLTFLISGIFVFMNLLYFTNLIPPIPLSLKEAGIYHSLQRNSDGNYVVGAEKRDWRSYFHLYQKFQEVSGEPVYAYSAIFSPSHLDTTIIHEWERKVNGKWILQSRINLPVVGGREDGFRTYSVRSNLASGKWRVNVKTERGQTIGTLRFEVVIGEKIPDLEFDIK